ncbi:hypothetical protein FE257_010716 [Aspergillus nanangensis]|uniref:Uncharacterized protein n=1 Tax=Aspergillus nanangensis TaxID=2582783 RepID=A0AAD4GRW4_ASPNN|nr:hypothetical protein FE257_010716 [Aspergillus nanangensis]
MAGLYQRGEERPLKRRSREMASHQSPRAKTADDPVPGMERSPRNKSVPLNQFDLGIQSCEQMNPDSIPGVLFPADQEFHPPIVQGSMPIDIPSDSVLGPPRDQSLHRLTDLSSKLSRELSNINSLKWTEIMSFSTSHSLKYAEHQQPGTPSSRKNVIGRVLDSSQTFLDILDGLPVPSRRDSSAESECSYFEYLDDADFAGTSSPEFVPHRNTTSTTTVAVPRLSSSSSSNHSPETQTIAHALDMPTLLTILTCYTWLLQAYHAIFSQIHSSLLTHADLPSHPIPPVLPGLHLGGFGLDDHRDLQIEMLMHIITMMLDRMEHKLGLKDQDAQSSTDSSTYHGQDGALNSRGGILGPASASDLLEVLSRHNRSGHYPHDTEGPKATAVKQIIRNIRVVLRDCRMLRAAG